jgi:hypothetical protein
MDDPLSGLDDVPRERLHLAYGPATDMPGLLRQIARGEADDETWDPSMKVNIAAPVTPDSMAADERRVVEALARSDAFWRTDSDLPMVYGLPARRCDFAALVGL